MPAASRLMLTPLHPQMRVHCPDGSSWFELRRKQMTRQQRPYSVKIAGTTTVAIGLLTNLVVIPLGGAAEMLASSQTGSNPEVRRCPC
jgi:hypothetical protein